jgi:pyruvate kinase
LKAGQIFKLCCKKKVLGDETFTVVDFQELENKLKVGDHVIVDFGSVCMRVIGFEDEGDFLVSKQLDGLEVPIYYFNYH